MLGHVCISACVTHSNWKRLRVFRTWMSWLDLDKPKWNPSLKEAAKDAIDNPHDTFLRSWIFLNANLTLTYICTGPRSRDRSELITLMTFPILSCKIIIIKNGQSVIAIATEDKKLDLENESCGFSLVMPIDFQAVT